MFLTAWLIVVLLMSSTTAMMESERLHLREEARAMFYHAYDNYMEYAFPVSVLWSISSCSRACASLQLMSTTCQSIDHDRQVVYQSVQIGSPNGLSWPYWRCHGST